MRKLLPVIAGALVVGAAMMMNVPKSTLKGAAKSLKSGAAAARSKITKKRAAHATARRKPARKR